MPSLPAGRRRIRHGIHGGRAAGVKLGRNLVVNKGTPLCNLWLSLLQGCGVNVERHGDSTGPLKEVMA
jgi:hypothetical protein